jgi:hypothetical protein
MLEKAGFKIVHLETNKARKGLLNKKGFNAYDNSAKPNNIMGRFLRSAKRDLKNTLNPMTYIGPLFDMAGYGFNLYVIASKQEDCFTEKAKRRFLYKKKPAGHESPTS